MSSVPPWLRRASLSLADRLDRPRHSLDSLREQVREAVAKQLGQTVVDAVREAVSLIIDQTADPRATVNRRPYGGHSRNPMWDEDDDQDRWSEHRDEWNDERHPPYRRESEPLQTVEVTRSHWTRAVLVGCEAAAWWLRQRWGRWPLLVAFFVGLLAGTVSFAGWPLAAALIGVVGPAVNLLALTRPLPSGFDLGPP